MNTSKINTIYNTNESHRCASWSNFIAKNVDACNSLPSHIFTESCFYGIFHQRDILILTAIKPYKYTKIGSLFLCVAAWSFCNENFELAHNHLAEVVQYRTIVIESNKNVPIWSVRNVHFDNKQLYRDKLLGFETSWMKCRTFTEWSWCKKSEKQSKEMNNWIFAKEKYSTKWKETHKIQMVASLSMTTSICFWCFTLQN